MNERLLQYIWQHQHFNRSELTTTDGDAVQIIQQGQINFNQGPDFLNARIKLNGHVIAGNIELHVKESDWLRHKHQQDPNYRNIILHVVWANDLESGRIKIPTLTLSDRVPRIMLQRYATLQAPGKDIACRGLLHQVQVLVWEKWKERLMIERLQRKAAMIKEWLAENNGDWGQCLWWIIARSYGLVINADAFVHLARSLDFNLFRKHIEQPLQIEAMIFGQAGLLKQEMNDHYVQKLLNEYRFLASKYGFTKPDVQFHFLRMRPPAFPTIRLAQLAALIYHSGGELAAIVNCATVGEMKNCIDVPPGDYWNNHFIFGEESVSSPKRPGNQLFTTVVLNAVVPFLFAYGEQLDRPDLREKALSLVAELAPEHNSITQTFAKAGIRNQNGIDSQSLIELKTQYCHQRRCLNCAVGRSILCEQITV